MAENNHNPVEESDVDLNGHLATALFVGVIAIILLIIYGLAMAA